MGDEGGFAPNIESAEKGMSSSQAKASLDVHRSSLSALDIIVQAIDKAGYKGKVKIGMDVAASEFYDEKEKKYDLNNKEPGRPHYVTKRLPKTTRMIAHLSLFTS